MWIVKNHEFYSICNSDHLVLRAIQHKKNPFRSWRKKHVELNNNSILKFLSYSQKRKKMKINLWFFYFLSFLSFKTVNQFNAIKPFVANNKPSITIGGDLNNIIRSIFAKVLDRENSILPYVAFSFMLIDESRHNNQAAVYI